MPTHFSSRSGISGELRDPETVKYIADQAAQTPGADANEFLHRLGGLGVRPGTLWDALQAGAVEVRSPNNVYPVEVPVAE